MEKITLGILEIIKANEAVHALLAQPGIVFQKNYWLDRLRKNLVAPLNKWQEISRQLFLKYAVEIPKTSFILYDKYQEFKKELIHLIEVENDGSILVDEFLKRFYALFEKYEVTSKSPGTFAIPIESKEQYDKEIKELAEGFEREIKYGKIDIDQPLMNVFQKISGESQLAIAFVLSEERPSGLIVMPGKKKTIQ